MLNGYLLPNVYVNFEVSIFYG